MLLIVILASFLSFTVAQDSTFACFVGYRIANSTAVGGSLPCSGETCLTVTGSLNGVPFNIFACEPLNICNVIDANPLPGITVGCCNDSSNCNVAGVPIPPPPTASTHTVPNVCNSGIYTYSTNNSINLKSETPVICYGDCASYSVSFATFNVSVLTCDPVNVCDHLELDNSCHSLSNGSLSACCCNSNLCIDPEQGIKPTPASPPPGSIQCPAGIEIVDKNGMLDTISAVTTVDCMGACHSTRYNGSDTFYDVYSCDNFGVCDMLDIPPEGCNFGIGSVTSCCCHKNFCNFDNTTTLIPQDPFPPNKAERCFSGFSLSSLGGVPIGQSDYCRGYCASYTIDNGLTIYGCDPVTICDTFNIHDDCSTHGSINGNDSLTVCCCSTPDCNRPIPPVQNNTCINGVSVDYGTGAKIKGENVSCSGPCGNFSAIVGSITVTVYACDALNICQLPDPGIPLNVQCCNGTNCNVGNIENYTPVNTTGMQNMTCFTGIDFRGNGAVGFHSPCQGHCSRVHLGSDTFYTCDPADICSDFGVDGCTILADGLSVCCCQGERCNDKDRRIEPHVSQNLSCLVGYGIGSIVIGGYQQCNGMCGQMSASLGTVNATAYVCLNYDICRDFDLYEECRNLRFDQAIRGCCCGTTGCNYHGNQTFPSPAPPTNAITCPSGVWINGVSSYDSNSITQCSGSCGSVTLGTTFNGTNASLTYYSCDPATFCQDLQLTNGCMQLTESFGFCCCNSVMCMDPLSQKFVPSPNPTPVVPTSVNCFVGYGVGNGTLVGGSVQCPGNCARASVPVGNNTVNLFACEPAGICSWHSPSSSLEISCCADSDNCNSNGYTTPTPSANPVSVPPIVCYEGVYLSGKLISGGASSLCQGYCAKLSTQGSNNFSFDVYTCDPVSLCDSFSLNNSCTNTSSGLITGCCCNSNLCLDPSNNITTPISPTQSPSNNGPASTAVSLVFLLALALFIN